MGRRGLQVVSKTLHDVRLTLPFARLTLYLVTLALHSVMPRLQLLRTHSQVQAVDCWLLGVRFTSSGCAALGRKRLRSVSRPVHSVWARAALVRNALRLLRAPCTS